MRCDERGFTLVEIVAALAVAGVIGAAMFKLLADQHRFYGETSDRTYAEETLRASAELVATELRPVTGSDVLAAEADSVAVWADVLAGHVCHVSSLDNVYYYVHHRPGSPSLLGDMGTAYRNPFATAFDYDPDFNPSGTASSVAESECEAVGAPADEAADRYRLTSWGGSLPPPEPGALIRVVRKLSYYFAPSEMGDGTALWRNDSELAGPFDSQGVGFRYRVCSGGGCSWHTDVADESDQRDIRTIELDARALGDGANRYGVALDLDYDITLRN